MAATWSSGKVVLSDPSGTMVVQHNTDRKDSSMYVKTKPSTITCDTCGVTVPVNPGPGRKPRFCPEHRKVTGQGVRLKQQERPAPRSLADHPALVARIEKNGPGRATAHRPLGIRTTTTTGKVPRRRGNE